MKKITFIASVLLAFSSLTSWAGNRIIFTENYESASGISDTKWGSNANVGGLSVGSDDFGKFLQISAGGNNQRSYNCNWTSAIYDGVVGENDEYDVKFDFCVNAMGTNQYNSEIALVGGDVKAENGATSNSNVLFKIDQVKNTDDASVLNYYINGNEADIWTPTVGAWYTFYIHVDKANRKVSYYAIDNASGSVAIPDGEYVLPETVTELNASHLWYAHARYYNVVYFDNITVYKDLGEGVDWANQPVIALTGILNNERTYSIAFMEGEVLHFTGTDGVEQEIAFEECETPGTFVYSTKTSGTITAYTQVNETKSEQNSIEVDCTPVKLPAATTSISAVKAGFAKDWIVTIDKSEVPLQPNIVFDYEFYPEGSATATLSGTEQASGSKVSIPEKGKLVVTSKAYGYEATSTEIVNDSEFKVVATVDFQNMTADELKSKGFVAMEKLNSATTSGESNWTGRNRLYCQYLNPAPVAEDGSDKYINAYPFGKGGEEGAGIERYQLLQSALTENVASTIFAPLKTWFNGDGATTYDPNETKASNGSGAKKTAAGTAGLTSNVKVYLGIGLVSAGSVGDADDFDPLGVGYGNILNQDLPINFQNLTAEDYVVVYSVGDYGSSAIHPQYDVATPEEAIALYKNEIIGAKTAVYQGNSEKFTFHRVDEAVARVEVLSPANATAVKTIEFNNAVVEDANAPIYTIGGVKVSTTVPGKIYIQNGKKFLAK